MEIIENNMIITIDVLNRIEQMTFSKIYNKEHIVKNDDIEVIKKEVLKNMICQIDFNKIFFSGLNFDIIFCYDDIKIFYNNILIIDDNIEFMINKSVEDNKFILPEFNKIYLQTIKIIIKNFIDKNIIVKYHCLNIPKPYLNLFLIKSNKIKNSNQEFIDEIEKIISGEIYKVPTQPIFLINKDKDDIIRMEVMSYLNDNDVITLLTSIDEFETIIQSCNNIDVINLLLKLENNNDNKMIKFYFVNLLFNFIIQLNKNNKINSIIDIKGKIDECVSTIIPDLYIIQSAGLMLSEEIEYNYNKYININNNTSDSDSKDDYDDEESKE